jgi:hypothetical protein
VEVTVSTLPCDTLNIASALQTTIPRSGSTTVYLNGTGFGTDPVGFGMFLQGTGTPLVNYTLTNTDPNDASFLFTCPAIAETDTLNIVAYDGAWNPAYTWGGPNPLNDCGPYSMTRAQIVITCQ